MCMCVRSADMLNLTQWKQGFKDISRYLSVAVSADKHCHTAHVLTLNVLHSCTHKHRYVTDKNKASLCDCRGLIKVEVRQKKNSFLLGYYTMLTAAVDTNLYLRDLNVLSRISKEA